MILWKWVFSLSCFLWLEDFLENRWRVTPVNRIFFFCFISCKGRRFWMGHAVIMCKPWCHCGDLCVFVESNWNEQCLIWLSIHGTLTGSYAHRVIWTCALLFSYLYKTGDDAVFGKIKIIYIFANMEQNCTLLKTCMAVDFIRGRNGEGPIE